MHIVGVFTVIRWHLWRRCKTVTFGKWGPWEPCSQFKTNMINIGQQIEVAERICMQQPHHAECISRINLCSLLFFVIYVSPHWRLHVPVFHLFASLTYLITGCSTYLFFFSQLLLFNSILTLNDSHELNSMREIYHGPKEIWDGIFFFVFLLLLRPKISIWSSLNLSSFDLLGGGNVSKPIRKSRQH